GCHRLTGQQAVAVGGVDDHPVIPRRRRLASNAGCVPDAPDRWHALRRTAARLHMPPVAAARGAKQFFLTPFTPLVRCPDAWPHSSLPMWVRQAAYAADWMCLCGGEHARPPDFGDIGDRAGE
ncbi:MAG: hypothetical protein ACE5FI_19475, partial [Anaerolineales bacterium]